MTFKSPLGRIGLPTRTTEARKPIIPERLRLPDGREFETADLVGRVTRPTNYNLRNKNPHKPLARTASKYTLDDHKWIVRATLEDIQIRYKLNENSARQLKYRSEKMPGVRLR